MKVKVLFQDKSLDYTIDYEITGIAQITQKLCQLFLISNYYAYSLFLTNGQIIDNINLIDEGSEISIKSLNKTINNSSPSVTTISSSANTTTLSSSPSPSTTASNPTTIQQPISIDNLLNNLKDNLNKKKAFFDLKDLKEEGLIKKFVEKNGIDLIVDQLKELTGNTKSYALSALHTIMSYEFGISSVSLDTQNNLITQLLPLTENISNPSICKTSLSLLCQFLNQHTTTCFKQYYTKIIVNYNQQNGRNYNSTLVQLLSHSNTVDVQLNSLTLINIIISKIQLIDGETGFNKLLGELDTFEINAKLRKLVESIIAPEMRRQLYLYQRHRFQVITNRKNVTFNKENPDHDALLMKLWSLTYPGVKLESKVSEQWKQMGFQGTDPCTDFRGMGIFGLDNLVYFAQHYNDKFRKIVNSQIERKDREYPTATAGIVLSYELYNSIFKMNLPIYQPPSTTSPSSTSTITSSTPIPQVPLQTPQVPLQTNSSQSSSSSTNGNGGTGNNQSNSDEVTMPLFPLFFSHPHAFEEVYCTTFQILDSTWDEMNGTYMYFQKIISSVKNLIISALESKPTTLDAFDWKCQKNNTKHQNGIISNSNDSSNQGNNSREDIKKLLSIVNRDVLETIKIQKTQYLYDGFQFKLQKPLKTKSSIPLNYFFIRLSPSSSSVNDSNPSNNDIQYCFLSNELSQLPQPLQPMMTNFNTIKVVDINFNGDSSNSNSKKKDKASFYFSIQIKDDQFQHLIQHQQPTSLSALSSPPQSPPITSPVLSSTPVNSGNTNNSISQQSSINVNISNSSSSGNSGSGNINQEAGSSNSGSGNNSGGVSGNQLPSSGTTSPIMIPQSQQSTMSINNPSQLSQLSPSSPSSNQSMLMVGSPMGTSSNLLTNSNSNTLELICNNREDVINFWDAIRLLSNQDIKSPEGLEDYQSLLNINTAVKLLDLEGIDIPKETPTIPLLPDNFDFRNL